LKKKILIATGGTGGHMTPALVIHDHLKKRFNLSISSDSRGLKFIDYKKYDLFVIETPRVFRNYFLIPFKMICILVLIIKSFYYIKKKKIDIIISTGGYAPVPICIAGIILKKRLYIYEPNHVIGKSNRFFLPYCHKIFCHSKNLKKYPKKFTNKIFCLSPIVRKKFYKKSKKNKSKFTIMVIGGSQGAKIFDKYLHIVFSKILKKSSAKIIHQTKSDNVNYLRNFYNKNKITNRVFNYDRNFADLIKSCNFCITRAGASTLAEIFILNIPFLAIPLSDSKDNHQLENAIYYKKKNCCWILEEKNMSYRKISNILKQILENKNDFDLKKTSMIKLNRNINWNLQNKILIKEFNAS